MAAQVRQQSVRSLGRRIRRLLDDRIQPGPRAQAAWDLADQVLAVADLPARHAVLAEDAFRLAEQVDVQISGVAGTGAVGDVEVVVEPTPTPPGDPEGDREWALQTAKFRHVKRKKGDFVTADLLRDRLRDHGFEVRDTQDGGVEVVRLG